MDFLVDDFSYQKKLKNMVHVLKRTVTGGNSLNQYRQKALPISPLKKFLI